MLAVLEASKMTWARLPISERLSLLKQCKSNIQANVGEWVRCAAERRGAAGSENVLAEEYMGGPFVTVRLINQYIATLSPAAEGQKRGDRTLQLAIPPVSKVDGRVVASVFPHGFVEKCAWSGFSAEVWLAPGASFEQNPLYTKQLFSSKFGISFILGAGNVSSVPISDILHKLLYDNEVVIMKFNPVNDYLYPFYAHAFAPLIKSGFVQLCCGGPELATFLINHSLVTSLHITGSQAVHDIIAFGAGEEQTRRKAAKDPKTTKPFTSELGCVTPIIIVPGNWSSSDIEFHASAVAGTLTNNCSYNCVAGKVLVMAQTWPQRDVFVRALKQKLSQVPSRCAYYPGSAQRYNAFKAAYPSMTVYCATKELPESHIGWSLIEGVSAQEGEYALTNEAFCPLMATLVVPEVTTVPDFLRSATSICNQLLYGQLSCCILIDPTTEKTNATAFRAALSELRYGTIAVNTWSAMGFALCVTPWGSYPGNPLENAGSGIGFVHNPHMIENVEKSVIRGPWRMPLGITSVASPLNKNHLGIAKASLNYEIKRSFSAALRVVWNAFWG
eukprot:gnl/Hemi2/28277_TR9340_c0_g1_i1.p1 gnl/Hemi2/28277_TR9340_c0_g1~~gnl/Hemi2/28277_TR9340_c0_g1_i1.p1  ORF type:complete len:579 (-),score=29.78 gnl/Hemi2/28277_TR9340_c0_g1_i1:180-1856(-)